MKIEVKKLTKKYDDFVVYDNAELSIYKPGLYLIDGPNACGKTTLFNAISGFDSYDTGLIRINGNLMKKNQISKDVSYYNVDYNLIDLLTVKENLALISDDYLDLVKRYGLEYVLDSKVSGISKGEKARIGILKNILLNKDIALFDEPFAYLDEDTAKEYIALLTEYAKDHIVLLISHVYKQYLPENKTVYTVENGKVVVTSGKRQKNYYLSSTPKDINKKNNFLKNFGLSWKIISNSKGKFITSVCLLFVTFLIAIPALNFTYESTQGLLNRYLKEIGATYGNVESKDYRNYIEKIDKTNEGTYIIDSEYNISTNLDNNKRQYTNFYSCNTKDIVINKKTYTFNQSNDYVELIVNKKAKAHIDQRFGSDEFGLPLTDSFNYESCQLTKFKVIDVVDINDTESNGFCLFNYDCLKKYNDNNLIAYLPDDIKVFKYDENQDIGDNNFELSFNHYNNESIGVYEAISDKLNLPKIELNDDEIVIANLANKSPKYAEIGDKLSLWNKKSKHKLKDVTVKDIIEINTDSLNNFNENYDKPIILVNQNNCDLISKPTQLYSCYTENSFNYTYLQIDDLEPIINNMNLKRFSGLDAIKDSYENPLDGVNFMGAVYDRTDDYISICQHANYSSIAAIISVVSSLIAIIFLLLFNKENYKKNNYNIYVLRQNGYSSSEISSILAASLINNMFVALICSIPAYFGVVYGLNAAFEVKATIALSRDVNRYPLNYFPDGYKGFFTVVGLSLLIALISYVVKLCVINKTATKNYLDNKSHDE